MKLIKYAELIAMSKEFKDKALAPIRAKQASVRFDAKLAELEENKMNAEAKIQELCSAHPLDVDKLVDAIDDIALLERRMIKVREIQVELFGD